MLILGLNEAMDHFDMASHVHWYCCVLRMEDGHVFGRELEFAVKG